MPIINLQKVVAKNISIPLKKNFNSWSKSALADLSKDTEVTIRIVDEKEMSVLNQQYRQKQGPTNVLAFPSEMPAELNIPYLGDIIICQPVVVRESKEQNITEEAHWAHLVIHGLLHLQGFDHIEEQDAIEMETREVQLMQALGFNNPYLEVKE